MPFKFKGRVGSETEQGDVTVPDRPDTSSLDDVIELCENCVSDEDEALDEEELSYVEWDKINENFPEPVHPANDMEGGYATFMELPESEQERLRKDWLELRDKWKSDPERIKAVATHRAKFPYFWSCVCG